MSFALTTDQVEAKIKTVTRRTGWKFLKPGTLLQPVVKCQGLKKGELVQKIGGPIRVVSVRRERLVERNSYGRDECAREGFPDMLTFAEFVDFFIAHNGGTLRQVVTRIEFEYLESARA